MRLSCNLIGTFLSGLHKPNSAIISVLLYFSCSVNKFFVIFLEKQALHNITKTSLDDSGKY